MSKKLIHIVFLGLIIGLLVLWQSDENANSFTLKLQGMQQLQIKRVLVKESKFTTAFYSIPDKWNEIEGLNITVTSLNQEGMATLTITTQDDQVLSISNVPFRLGKTTYINEHDGKLSYVKAHW